MVESTTEETTQDKRITEVEWEDASSSHGWQEKADLPNPWIVHTVGYVDRDDDEGIVLVEARVFSGDFGRDSPKDRKRNYGCATAIPRSAIRKITELR
jgi:hypothetical protein